jgi:hypothetical protein
MATIIPDDLLQQLEDIAQEEGRTPAELLRALLSQYPRQKSDSPPPGSLAELAENARKAAISSPHPVDTAERSREILDAEFANYLKSRMEEGTDATDSGW